VKISEQLRKVELLERFYKFGWGGLLPSESKDFSDAMIENVKGNGIIVPSKIGFPNNYKKGHKVELLCETDKIYYESLNHLARELNCSITKITKALNSNGIINGKKYRVL